MVAEVLENYPRKRKRHTLGPMQQKLKVKNMDKLQSKIANKELKGQ